jgi:hypothetical protein
MLICSQTIFLTSPIPRLGRELAADVIRTRKSIEVKEKSRGFDLG